jgi:hypothetical protein
MRSKTQVAVTVKVDVAIEYLRLFQQGGRGATRAGLNRTSAEFWERNVLTRHYIGGST